jgi:hypothetical protein
LNRSSNSPKKSFNFFDTIDLIYQHGGRCDRGRIYRRTEEHHPPEGQQGMTRDQAFHFLKRKIGRAPAQYEQEIEEIIELADGNLSDHDRSRIDNLAHWANIEHARLHDLEELEGTGWSP